MCVLFLVLFSLISAPLAAQESARFTILICSGTPDEKLACEVGKKRFAVQYDAALRGDYQAWRNVAYTLYRGAPGTNINRVQACAWRLFIVASGSPRVDTTDTGNMRVECGQLDRKDQEDARVLARSIYAQVSAGKGDPTPVQRGPATQLDGTAYPLGTR